MNKFKHLIFAATFVTVTGFCVSAPAYLSIGESAEILPLSDYQVGLEPQFLLNKGGGANLNAFFDAPFNNSTSGRISLGAGSVDFSTFASIKYVPFPDVDNQPAIGIRAGVGIARDESESILLAQISPLISKKTPTDIGLLTPYLAIPLQIINNKKETFTGSNFVVGSEYSHADLPEARFGGEIGFELSKSYSYLSVFVTIPFDSSKGFTRR